MQKMAEKFQHNDVPPKAGIGLRHPHYKQVMAEKPNIEWFEVHSENFFADGGMNIHVIENVRSKYPMSFHGVGLSLGSADKLDEKHLQKLKRLVDNFEPGLVSEHISWSAIGGVFANDLLPVPYNLEAIEALVLNISQMQEYLGRQILIENPSSYLEYKISEMTEWEFINQVIAKSGCGLLLDINNIYVSAQNHDFSADRYIENINKEAIGEIHLAGHESRDLGDGQAILIDSHSRNVKDDVWKLYEKTIKLVGNKPTLIEWDTDIPELSILMDEAAKAQTIMDVNK